MRNFKLYQFSFATILICFVMMSFRTQAQVEQGKLLVGGALSYQTGASFEFAGQEVETAGSDLNVFAFAPRVGYAISDNFVVGGRLALAFGTEEQEVLGETIEARSTGFAFAPFGRYYMPLNDKAYFFGEALVNFGSVNLTLDGEDLASFSLFQIGISPGFAYFISEKVSIEFLVNGISYVSFKEEDAEEADDSINIGPNFDRMGPVLAIQFFF